MHVFGKIRGIFVGAVFLLAFQGAVFGEEGKPFVLVTGGAGYIGSHTCKALADAGFIPVVYDSLLTGAKEAVKWGPLVVADLNDRGALDRAIEEYHPVGVIHFAALIAVGESVAHPAKFYWNNVVGSLNLLEAVKDHKIPAFIFSSTAATYGIPEGDTVDELSPQRPINPYGNTKFFVEKMLADFERAYGTRYVCFRYFNAAGADLDGELGPNFKRATHLIPLIIQAAAGKRPHLEVYGTDFPTPDGTGIRDYIHVADLARAHVLGLKYLLEGNQSVTLNLGAGQGYSVKEVIQTAQKVIPYPIPVVYSDRRAGDPPAVVADSQKAKEVLGWEAEHSDLESIIRSSWKWFKSSARSD